MSRPRAAMKKAKFHKEQVVVIRGMQPPMGCVSIVHPLDQEGLMWLGLVEQDGEVAEREFTVGELRPLTARESGRRGGKRK